MALLQSGVHVEIGALLEGGEELMVGAVAGAAEDHGQEGVVLAETDERLEGGLGEVHEERNAVACELGKERADDVLVGAEATG